MHVKDPWAHWWVVIAMPNGSTTRSSESRRRRRCARPSRCWASGNASRAIGPGTKSNLKKKRRKFLCKRCITCMYVNQI